MAYKEMPFRIYLTVTLVLYFGEMAGAILIEDIGLIFEFVSAISVSCLAFIFPGAFFIMAERKFCTEFQKAQNSRMRLQAWLFLILGICAFLFFITANVMEIIYEADHDTLIEKEDHGH